MLETKFREYCGINDDTHIDELSKSILIQMKYDLYPSDAPSPLTYKDVMALTISCAPQNEWDLWDSLMYNLPYRPQDNAMLDSIVSGVFHYYREYRAPYLVYYIPLTDERECLQNLAYIARESLTIPENERLDWLTSAVYEVGKTFYLTQEMRTILANGAEASGLTEAEYKNIQKESQSILRNFFAMTYSVMLGQTDGPRLPNFITMMGPNKFADYIEGIIDCVGYGYY